MLRPRRFRSAVFMLSCALLALSAACSDSLTGGSGNPSDPASENFASSLGVNLAQMTERASRLYVQDLVVGAGREAVAGDSLAVRYTGWLRTGMQFDSNVSAGQPFQFKLGVGRVISGWDLGVPGMRVGGKRRLILGSEYGYRGQGSGSIPPNATLVFDVELISIMN